MSKKATRKTRVPRVRVKATPKPNEFRLIGTNVVRDPGPAGTPKVWVPQDRHIYEFEVAKLKRQHNCSHRKGAAWSVFTPSTGGLKRPADPSQGSWHPMRAVFPLPPFVFDFNVSVHTFPDLHQEIKCLTCKRVWKSGDFDFDAAMNMVRNSSNTPSASEALLQIPPGWGKLTPTVTVQDDLLYNKKEKNNNGKRIEI